MQLNDTQLIEKLKDGTIIDEFWLPYNKNKHSSPVNYVFVIKKNAG
jgi:hypothetical protein